MSDLSLLQEFIFETTEHLEELEQNLLHLEAHPNDKEILDEIFRSIHTIKGASEYLAMNRIADLSHKLENLLDMLRHGEKKADSTIIMLLIDSSDRIGKLIAEIDETGSEKSDVVDLTKRLDALDSGSMNEDDSMEKEIKDESPTISSPLPEYEEEYDKELFSIYIEQLKESLVELVDLLSGLLESDDPAMILNGCLEITDNLKSSSNYMGYDKLTNIYDSWLSSINNMADKTQKETNQADINELIKSVIKPGLDKIMAIFPVVKLHPDTEDLHNRLDTLMHNKQKSNSPESDPEIFDEMINNMFSDIEENDDDDFELFISETTKETSANQCTYDEENDTELFDIFLDQLHENIEELKAQAESPEKSNDLSAMVDSCSDIVLKLKSSAGYMGYVELVDYYNQWIERLVKLKNQLLAGHEIQADSFIESEIFLAIDGALNFFPAHVREKQSICKSALAASIDKHYDIGKESVSDDLSTQKIPLTDNPELLDKLSAAFDSKLSTHKEEESWDIEEMENELFSISNDPYDFEITTKNETVLLNIHNQNQFTDEDVKPVEEVSTIENSLSSYPESANLTQDLVEPTHHEPTNDENFEKETVSKEKINQKSVRVDAEKIDSLMNQVGELVVSRAWFSQLFNEIKTLQFDLIQNNNINPREIKQFRNFSFKLSEATASLGRLANELQEGVMKVRMLPIERLFNRYPRLVRDLAQRNGKEVELIISGADTELDKMVIEKISDPLIHIIRNAVDHGIETPEKRELTGKSRKGEITLDAYHESNHVVIEITDNGKGIDTELIREKALKQKLVSHDELSNMSEKEVCRLILKPGFSTAGKVTQTSGRGVGMDIVKKNIEKLNGIIDIYSVTGKETRFRIKIPLTLAIIPALLVKVGEELFTIPLSTVEETLRLNDHKISTIEGIEVIKMKNSTLPLIRLATIFRLNNKKENTENSNSFVVVVNNGIKNVGLVVDRLVRQEEVVIKPLEDYLQEKSGFSGATILGDGRISLILDIYELVNMSLSRQKSRKEKALAV